FLAMCVPFFSTQHRAATREVAQDYIGEMDEGACSREPDATAELRGSWRQRATAFLRGKRKAEHSAGERFVNRHRVKAHHWMARLGNALSVHCGAGLKCFQQPRELADRNADPLLWPRLSIASDSRPDVRCAMHFM
ncbi:MAG: hypothetical protein ACKPKO_22290, partial [Candidatus Fonsibacter sp.]